MRKLLPGLLVIGAVIFFCVYLLWSAVQGFRSISYWSKDHPPAETFRRYFDEVPPGVSDIRAEGHSTFGGAAIWMRFHADEGAVARLTRGYKRLSAKEAKERLKGLTEKGSSTDPTTEPYKQWERYPVRWEGLKKIRTPEVYEKPYEYAGVEDTLVVDRDRQTVYYYHWNQ